MSLLLFVVMLFFAAVDDEMSLDGRAKGERKDIAAAQRGCTDER